MQTKPQNVAFNCNYWKVLPLHRPVTDAITIATAFLFVKPNWFIFLPNSCSTFDNASIDRGSVVGQAVSRVMVGAATHLLQLKIEKCMQGIHPQQVKTNLSIYAEHVARLGLGLVPNCQKPRPFTKPRTPLSHKHQPSHFERPLLNRPHTICIALP